MSLSEEPITSILKDEFVCGTKDITGLPYAGRSGMHAVDGQAINTTNGAGPHNLQLFVLAPDGTVMHCLPGFWNAEDLATELDFAMQVYGVYQNPQLSRAQKNQYFTAMQLNHTQQHSPKMVRRSRMQGFDQKYEAKNRLHQSDTIKDVNLAAASVSKTMMNPKQANQAFKTTDQIMHERMAQRPFVKYEQFDVAAFSDYGRPLYEKHEDQRDLSGQRITSGAGGNSLPKRVTRSALVKTYNWGRRLAR